MTARSGTALARGGSMPAAPTGAAQELVTGGEAREAAEGGRRRVILIGPEAASLASRLPADVVADPFETFLDAVLSFSGGAACEAVFAAVSQEIDDLEQAVKSLRKVCGGVPIVLLCDPPEEPACRRARAWGADNYLVMPVSKASVERAMGRGAEAITAVRRPAASPAQALASPVQLTVAQMPLLVECSLANDLLAGRTDFVDRAVASLQGYVRLGGTIRFEAQLPEPAQAEKPGALSATVAHGGMTFGTLVLDGPAGNEAATLLGQAATWLAGWLAMAHRNEQLRTLAITDELTDAFNRRYFKRFTASLLERAKVERFRVSVLLFDIDNFKKYNDHYGHPAGDAIIKEVIRLLRTCTRPHDLVARLGGDEFAVVFWDNEPPRQPGSQHPKDAVTATERFRKVLESHDWCAGCNIQGSVSISGGLATFPWDGDTVEALVARADEALLRAKAMGKNAIVLQECGDGA